VNERELLVGRELVRREPGELNDIVGRTLDPARDACVPGQTEDGPALVIRLHPDADELLRLDLQPRFLAQLPDERIERVFVLLEEAAGQIPFSDARFVGAAAEQQLSVALDESLHGGGRVCPDDVAARRTGEVVASVLAFRAAAGADTPAVEKRHRGYGIPVSPRHVPATVHELTRVELLSGLPGEQLAQLAGRLEREEVSPGSTVVRQGEPGDRFYIVLSGMLNVTQDELGERRTLRPGDSFGEVALVMGIPRTASVRAITPAVVASCDKETFDELLRPIFADE
jgi:hypothetical protein